MKGTLARRMLLGALAVAVSLVAAATSVGSGPADQGLPVTGPSIAGRIGSPARSGA